MVQVRKQQFHSDGGDTKTAQRPAPLRMVEMPPAASDAVPALTRRERQCLSWCAEGKSYWETAVILGITERTVSFHMEAVRGKLQAASNAHAVAMGVRAGLLEAGARPARDLR